MYLGIIVKEIVEKDAVKEQAERPEIRDDEGRILRAKVPAIPAQPEVRTKVVHRVFMEQEANRVLQYLNQSDQFQFYRIDAQVDSCTLTPVSVKRTGATEVREVVELEAGGETIAKATL